MDKATNTNGSWSYTINNLFLGSPSAAMNYLIAQREHSSQSAAQVLAMLHASAATPKVEASKEKLDRVVEKIRKLMNLAESNNENEAASAAALAQRLMVQYDLESAVLAAEAGDDAKEQEEDIEESSMGDLESFARRAAWKDWLIMYITKANGVYVYTSHKGMQGKCKTYRLIGQPRHVATVRYLYVYLAREIERHSKAQGKGKGAVWSNTFRQSAALTVGERLKEANRAEADAAKNRLAGNCTALVAVETAEQRIGERASEAKAWSRKQHGKFTTGQSGRSRYDSAGAAAGRACGASLNLSGARRLSA